MTQKNPDFNSRPVYILERLVYLILIISVLVLNSCSVGKYPRPATFGERVMTNIGYTADTMCAFLYKLSLGGKPGYDINRQMVQIDNYMFYADDRFYTNPDKFYSLPDKLPLMKSKILENTKQYSVILLSWQSQYSPLNSKFQPLYQLYSENHTAYAVLYKAKKKNCGAMVFLHGWTGGDITKSRKGENLERFLALGYDVALLQHPYHGLRTPIDSKFSGEYFISGEISRMNEAMRQAVTDTLSLYNYLREDYQVVGVRGSSLGGTTALNTAVIKNDLDFVIALAPFSELSEIREDTKFTSYVAKGMERSGLKKEILNRVLHTINPANYTPGIPKQNILLIAGMGDNFVPPAQTLKVWEAWEHPLIHWYPGGHVIRFYNKESMEIENDFLLNHLKKRTLSYHGIHKKKQVEQ